jgi:hypothetical protein
MTASTEFLTGVNQQIAQTKSAMETLQSEIGQRVHRELQAPIETSITSCRSLAMQLDHPINLV